MNDRLLQLRDNLRLNSVSDPSIVPNDAINGLLSEFANYECEINEMGNVWDKRGRWWNDWDKEQFLKWVEGK